jgi:hypothetical protein
MKNDIDTLFVVVVYASVTAFLFFTAFFFIGYAIGNFICKCINWFH